MAETLRAAHRKAYDIIKAGPGDGPVGMTLAMHDFQPASPDAVSATTLARRMMEDLFLENCRGDDFIGVQTYTRLRIGADGQRVPPGPDVESTQMGWEFWPQALEATIRNAWAVTHGVPILVTENGYEGDDDQRRIAYTETALSGVLACLADGIDVRGYTCWSLLDNFEPIFLSCP